MAGFYPYNQLGYGGTVQSWEGYAVHNTDITVGDALTIDANGYYALMASGGRCDGVCGTDVTGVSGVYPKITVWSPGQIFKVVTETTAPAQANVGGALTAAIDISTATTGAFAVDPGSSTNDDFMMLGIVYRTPDRSDTLAAGHEVYGIFTDTILMMKA